MTRPTTTLPTELREEFRLLASRMTVYYFSVAEWDEAERWSRALWILEHPFDDPDGQDRTPTR